jgi:tRNA(fMet)-specific endonuclease VapC
MPLFMLATDISSYIMKRSDKAVLNRLRQTSADDVCISVVTKWELMFGVEISPRRVENQAAIAGYLRNIEVLDLPVESAAHYAEIRAYLRSSGTPIGANDLFIAAHARSLGMTLVTNNTREFHRVPGLTVENWS